MLLSKQQFQTQLCALSQMTQEDAERFVMRGFVTMISKGENHGYDDAILSNSDLLQSRIQMYNLTSSWLTIQDFIQRFSDHSITQAQLEQLIQKHLLSPDEAMETFPGSERYLLSDALLLHPDYIFSQLDELEAQTQDEEDELFDLLDQMSVDDASETPTETPTTEEIPLDEQTIEYVDEYDGKKHKKPSYKPQQLTQEPPVIVPPVQPPAYSTPESTPTDYSHPYNSDSDYGSSFSGSPQYNNHPVSANAPQVTAPQSDPAYESTPSDVSQDTTNVKSADLSQPSKQIYEVPTTPNVPPADDFITPPVTHDNVSYPKATPPEPTPSFTRDENGFLRPAAQPDPYDATLPKDFNQPRFTVEGTPVAQGPADLRTVNEDGTYSYGTSVGKEARSEAIEKVQNEISDVGSASTPSNGVPSSEHPSPTQKPYHETPLSGSPAPQEPKPTPGMQDAKEPITDATYGKKPDFLHEDKSTDQQHVSTGHNTFSGYQGNAEAKQIAADQVRREMEGISGTTAKPSYERDHFKSAPSAAGTEPTSHQTEKQDTYDPYTQTQYAGKTQTQDDRSPASSEHSSSRQPKAPELSQPYPADNTHPAYQKKTIETPSANQTQSDGAHVSAGHNAFSGSNIGKEGRDAAAKITEEDLQRAAKSPSGTHEQSAESTIIRGKDGFITNDPYENFNATKKTSENNNRYYVDYQTASRVATATVVSQTVISDQALNTIVMHARQTNQTVDLPMQNGTMLRIQPAKNHNYTVSLIGYDAQNPGKMNARVVYSSDGNVGSLGSIYDTYVDGMNARNVERNHTDTIQQRNDLMVEYALGAVRIAPIRQGSLEPAEPGSASSSEMAKKQPLNTKKDEKNTTYIMPIGVRFISSKTYTELVQHGYQNIQLDGTTVSLKDYKSMVQHDAPTSNLYSGVYLGDQKEIQKRIVSSALRDQQTQVIKNNLSLNGKEVKENAQPNSQNSLPPTKNIPGKPVRGFAAVAALLQNTIPKTTKSNAALEETRQNDFLAQEIAREKSLSKSADQTNLLSQIQRGRTVKEIADSDASNASPKKISQNKREVKDRMLGQTVHPAVSKAETSETMTRVKDPSVKGLNAGKVFTTTMEDEHGNTMKVTIMDSKKNGNGYIISVDGAEKFKLRVLGNAVRDTQMPMETIASQALQNGTTGSILVQGHQKSMQKANLILPGSASPFADQKTTKLPKLVFVNPEGVYYRSAQKKAKSKGMNQLYNKSTFEGAMSAVVFSASRHAIRQMRKANFDINTLSQIVQSNNFDRFTGQNAKNLVSHSLIEQGVLNNGDAELSDIIAQIRQMSPEEFGSFLANATMLSHEQKADLYQLHPASSSISLDRVLDRSFTVGHSSDHLRLLNRIEARNQNRRYMRLFDPEKSKAYKERKQAWSKIKQNGSGLVNIGWRSLRELIAGDIMHSDEAFLVGMRQMFGYNSVFFMLTQIGYHQNKVMELVSSQKKLNMQLLDREQVQMAHRLGINPSLLKAVQGADKPLTYAQLRSNRKHNRSLLMKGVRQNTLRVFNFDITKFSTHALLKALRDNSILGVELTEEQRLLVSDTLKLRSIQSGDLVGFDYSARLAELGLNDSLDTNQTFILGNAKDMRSLNEHLSNITASQEILAILNGRQITQLSQSELQLLMDGKLLNKKEMSVENVRNILKQHRLFNNLSDGKIQKIIELIQKVATATFEINLSKNKKDAKYRENQEIRSILMRKLIQTFSGTSFGSGLAYLRKGFRYGMSTWRAMKAIVIFNRVARKMIFNALRNTKIAKKILNSNLKVIRGMRDLAHKRQMKKQIKTTVNDAFKANKRIAKSNRIARRKQKRADRIKKVRNKVPRLSRAGDKFRKIGKRIGGRFSKAKQSLQKISQRIMAPFRAVAKIKQQINKLLLKLAKPVAIGFGVFLLLYVGIGAITGLVNTLQASSWTNEDDNAVVAQAASDGEVYDLDPSASLTFDRVQYCIGMDSVLKLYVEGFSNSKEVINNVTDDPNVAAEKYGWFDPKANKFLNLSSMGSTYNKIPTGVNYSYYDGDGNLVGLKSNAKDIVALANAWLTEDSTDKSYPKGLFKSYVEKIWNFSHAVAYNPRPFNFKDPSTGSLYTQYVYGCDLLDPDSECYGNIYEFKCNNSSDNLYKIPSGQSQTAAALMNPNRGKSFIMLDTSKYLKSGGSALLVDGKAQFTDNSVFLNSNTDLIPDYSAHGCELHKMTYHTLPSGEITARVLFGTSSTSTVQFGNENNSEHSGEDGYTKTTIHFYSSKPCSGAVTIKYSYSDSSGIVHKNQNAYYCPGHNPTDCHETKTKNAKIVIGDPNNIIQHSFGGQKITLTVGGITYDGWTGSTGFTTNPAHKTLTGQYCSSATQNGVNHYLSDDYNTAKSKCSNVSSHTIQVPTTTFHGTPQDVSGMAYNSGGIWYGATQTIQNGTESLPATGCSGYHAWHTCVFWKTNGTPISPGSYIYGSDGNTYIVPNSWINIGKRRDAVYAIDGSCICGKCHLITGDYGLRYYADAEHTRPIYSEGTVIYQCHGHNSTTNKTLYVCGGHTVHYCTGHVQAMESSYKYTYCDGYCPGHALTYCHGHVDLDISVVTLFLDHTEGDPVLQTVDLQNENTIEKLGVPASIDEEYKKQSGIKTTYDLNSDALYTIQKARSGTGYLYKSIPVFNQIQSRFSLPDTEEFWNLLDQQINLQLKYVNNVGSAKYSIKFYPHFYNDANHKCYDKDNPKTMNDILSYYYKYFEEEDWKDWNDAITGWTAVFNYGVGIDFADAKHVAGVYKKFGKHNYFGGWYQYDDAGNILKTTDSATGRTYYKDAGQLSRAYSLLNDDWKTLYGITFPGLNNRVIEDDELKALLIYAEKCNFNITNPTGNPDNLAERTFIQKIMSILNTTRVVLDESGAPSTLQSYQVYDKDDTVSDHQSGIKKYNCDYIAERYEEINGISLNLDFNAFIATNIDPNKALVGKGTRIDIAAKQELGKSPSSTLSDSDWNTYLSSIRIGDVIGLENEAYIVLYNNYDQVQSEYKGVGNGEKWKYAHIVVATASGGGAPRLFSIPAEMLGELKVSDKSGSMTKENAFWILNGSYHDPL